MWSYVSLLRKTQEVQGNQVQLEEREGFQHPPSFRSYVSGPDL